MKISKNKKVSKKGCALYLAVAFFFTLFSFGNKAFAYTEWVPDSYGTNGSTAEYMDFIGANGNPPGASGNNNIGEIWVYGCGSEPVVINTGSDPCFTGEGGGIGWNFVTPESRAFVPWTLSTGSYVYYYAENTGGGALPVIAQTTFSWDAGTKTITYNAPPTNSSVTITSPVSSTYPNNPITFSGTYTNVATFNQIQFELWFSVQLPIAALQPSVPHHPIQF